LPEAYGFAASDINVRADRKQPVNCDGETVTKTPAHFSVERGALRVFVPSDFVDGAQ